LRGLWALLAAGILLRAAMAWGRIGGAPGFGRWGIGAALLASPVLAFGTAHLLPAMPAALLAGELLFRALRPEAERGGRSSGGVVWTGLLGGLLLGWFPFTWPVVALALLLFRVRGAGWGGTVSAAAVALFLGLALDPIRLQEPARLLARVAGVWRREGGWGGPGGPGLAGFLALAGGLGAVAWLLWPLAAARGWRTDRGRLLAGAGVWALLVLLPAATGVRRPGSVQWAAAPWLLAWGMGAAFAWGRSTGRGRRAGIAAAPALLLAVAVIAGALPSRLALQRRGEEAVALLDAVRADLRARLGPGALCVSEAPVAPGEEDALARRVFLLPRDSRHPERYDFAYWPRWFAGFRWVLLSSARVRENLGRPSAAAPRHFYAAVQSDGTLEREWGSGSGEGYRLYRIRDDAGWAQPLTHEELEEVRGGPELTWFLAQLGDRYVQAEALRTAETLFQAGLRWDPEAAGMYNNLGSVYLRLGDVPEAGRTFEAGLQRDPDSFELTLNLGIACSAQGLFERGEKVLRQATTLRPEHAPAHYELGRVFLAQGKDDLARMALERTLALDPAYPRRAEIESVLKRLAEGGGE